MSVVEFNQKQEGIEQFSYRGKHFTVPELSGDGLYLRPNQNAQIPAIPLDSPIIQDLNSIWDLQKFMIPRIPVYAGALSPEDLTIFTTPGARRTLDMPIKFPGSEIRLPVELGQFERAVQKIIDYERAVNPSCYDEYFCYLTVDQGMVQPGALQREAPCHVDGFQGARWNPKTKINHTYTVSDALPTVFYPQPFDFSRLDEAKHNFFWEMNRQVAETNSAYAWQGNSGEILLMDAYSVHRGVEADKPTYRTWIRLSFEVRIFDRLGNAHNPMFNYAWNMQPRDIESLGLEAFVPTSDPSLRVFPWQAPDGSALPAGAQKSQPKLRNDAFGGVTLPDIPGATT